MQEPEIRIYFKPLPESIRGAVSQAGAGYIVLVNEALTPEQQRRTIEHELDHIFFKDLEKDESADAIEYRQHKADRRRLNHAEH